MNTKEISVTVLTKNSQKYLKEVLKALAPFDEVLVYDTGSEDDTIAIAKRFPNVRVIEELFIGFGPTHNMASAAAKHQWILSIDSDEVVTPEMIQEMNKITLDDDAVYTFARHNYYNGKFIKWCGWYPDRQIRLYNKTKTRFSDDQVHEAIISQGMKKIALDAHFVHHSYSNISDFLAKMQSYSTLFAQQNCGVVSSSVPKALLHGFYAFFKSYLLQLGILGGFEGFLISSYNGHTAFYKYIKLREANKELLKSKQEAERRG